MEEVILANLERLAGEGFTDTAVEAAVNTIEFSLRENNTGSFPRGLSLMLRAMSSWIYDRDPFQPLQWTRDLSHFKVGPWPVPLRLLFSSAWVCSAIRGSMCGAASEFSLAHWCPHLAGGMPRYDGASMRMAGSLQHWRLSCCIYDRAFARAKAPIADVGASWCGIVVHRRGWRLGRISSAPSSGSSCWTINTGKLPNVATVAVQCGMCERIGHVVLQTAHVASLLSSPAD